MEVDSDAEASQEESCLADGAHGHEAEESVQQVQQADKSHDKEPDWSAEMDAPLEKTKGKCDVCSAARSKASPFCIVHKRTYDSLMRQALHQDVLNKKHKDRCWKWKHLRWQA